MKIALHNVLKKYLRSKNNGNWLQKTLRLNGLFSRYGHLNTPRKKNHFLTPIKFKKNS